MDLVRLAVIASSHDTRIELCRVADGPYEGVPVAVKRLDEGHPPAALAALRDETWFAATVDHPHVVRVVSWGEDDTGPFIAMEYVHGVSLARLSRTVFRTGEQFSERMVVYLAAKVSEGLAAVHQLSGADGRPLRLVHGNLAPDNLIVGFEGEVKIGDFGFAHAGVTPRTIEGMLPDPAYMAPERLLGTQASSSADVFSFGVVLYELLAHRRPRRGRTVEELAAEHERVEGFDLRAEAPRTDDFLIDLVNRCLLLDPSARPTSSAIASELAEWLSANGWEDGGDHLGRFVRRNALKQSRWLERALRGELDEAEPAAREAHESAREVSIGDDVAPAPAAVEAPVEPPPPSLEATRIEQSAQAAMAKAKAAAVAVEEGQDTSKLSAIVDDETALDSPLEGRVVEEEERIVDRLRTLVPAAEAAARAARLAATAAETAAGKVEAAMARLELVERARELLERGDRIEAEVAFSRATREPDHDP